MSDICSSMCLWTGSRLIMNSTLLPSLHSTEKKELFHNGPEGGHAHFVRARRVAQRRGYQS
jgi:hypothetical protein